jgi:hypothetical protein
VVDCLTVGVLAARIIWNNARILAVVFDAGAVVFALVVIATLANLDRVASRVRISGGSRGTIARGATVLYGAESRGRANGFGARVNAASVATRLILLAIAVSLAANLYWLGNEFTLSVVSPVDVSWLTLADHHPLWQLVLDRTLCVFGAGLDSEARIRATVIKASFLARTLRVAAAFVLFHNRFRDWSALFPVRIAREVRNAVAYSAVFLCRAVGVSCALCARIDALFVVTPQRLGTFRVGKALVAPATVVGVALVSLEAGADA